MLFAYYLLYTYSLFTYTDYVIEKIHLNFELTGANTVVTATSNVLKNTQVKGSKKADLILDGEELELVSVAINKKIIGSLTHMYVHSLIHTHSTLTQR